MLEDYYKEMICTGAHSSSPFQQKILTNWLRWIASQAPIKKALDLCCGLGFNLSALARLSSQVLAIDLSEPVLKVAKKTHSGLKNIKYLAGDAHNLNLPDSQFDLVVCTEALEHVRNPQKVIAECHRILKPYGFLIISTPNYQNLTGVIKWFKDKKAGRQYWEPWGAHKEGLERRMTPHVLHGILSPYFKIRETQGVNYLRAWFYFLPLRKYYDNFPFLTLGKLPVIKKFGMQYYVLAQKK